MNAFEQLVERLKAEFADASISIDLPHHPNGTWIVDVALSKNVAVVEWRRTVGFGVSSLPSEGYGERADELYEDVEEVLIRLKQLLREGQRTAPPAQTLLRDLRERRNISQEELAEGLGVSQAAISRLERRGDMNISSLRRLIRGLGGELEIHARFPKGVVEITQFRGSDSE